jgi:hypothetical protein
MTPSPTASPAESGGAIFANPEQLLAGLWLLLGFGLFAILAVIIFILLAQNRYFRAVEVLARQGMRSTPGESSATIGPIAGQGPTELMPADAIEITGPNALTVGKPGFYVAKKGPNPAPVTWSVDPAEGTKLEPAGQTAAVQITITKAGPTKVIGTSDGDSGTLAVDVQEPADAGSTVLGYIGAGWGSVVVSILVAAVVGALALANVLDGQAVAGLYGALLGYLFGVQVRAGSATPNAGQLGGQANSGTP